VFLWAQTHPIRKKKKDKKQTILVPPFLPPTSEGKAEVAIRKKKKEKKKQSPVGAKWCRGGKKKRGRGIPSFFSQEFPFFARHQGEKNQATHLFFVVRGEKSLIFSLRVGGKKERGGKDRRYHL